MTTPRTVFLIWRPWLGPFQLALAAELRRRGAAIHLYAHSTDGAETVRRQASADLFERCSPFQIIYGVAERPARPPAEEIARARAHEIWLGVPYGHIAVADRHLGRGFALGGVRFPTSRPSRASRTQVLAAISAQIEFWLREIEIHKPDLVLDAEKILDLVARRHQIPVRVLAASRHANFYYWAHDFYLRSPEIKAAYLSLLAAGEPHSTAAEVEQATAVVSYWKTAMATSKLSHFARQAGYQVAQRAWYRLRGKPLHNVYDLSSNIAYLWRTRSNTRLMTAPGMKRLSDLKDTRFVFFPLATEPEATLQGLSPEYFFQLESIATISRDLPADVLLAVKEHHPACGARDDSFYETIKAFKNVVMLDMREHGPRVIRQADVTVTISGSAGFEAATMGKPTIVLGRNNIYDFLPHVRTVRDPADMRLALDDALSGRLVADNARIDGAHFLSAMQRISFDLEAFDPFSKQSHVSSDAGVRAIDALIRSIAPTQVAA
jgi:hypothetical protein